MITAHLRDHLVEYEALGVGALVRRATSVEVGSGLGSVGTNRGADFAYSRSNGLVCGGVDMIVSGSD